MTSAQKWWNSGIMEHQSNDVVDFGKDQRLRKITRIPKNASKITGFEFYMI
jgi:hypothetical protein